MTYLCSFYVYECPRKLDPLEFKLQLVVNPHVNARSEPASSASVLSC